MHLSPRTQSFVNFFFILNFYEFLHIKLHYTIKLIKDLIISKK